MTRSSRTLKTALILASFISLAGCGKRGPLVYPDLVVPQAPTSVEARAFGEGIRVSLVIPSSPKLDNDPKGIVEVRVFRQDAPISQMLCRECKDSMPFYKTIYLDRLFREERLGSQVLYLDSEVQVERIYRYRFALHTRDGITGIKSEPVTASVMKSFPAPQLSVESTPTEAILRISGERPGDDLFAGYAIYRRTKDAERSLMPLLTIPIKETVYTDFTLKRGVGYLYGVRSVYRNAEGELAESLMSNEVEAERSKDE